MRGLNSKHGRRLWRSSARSERMPPVLPQASGFESETFLNLLECQQGLSTPRRGNGRFSNHRRVENGHRGEEDIRSMVSRISEQRRMHRSHHAAAIELPPACAATCYRVIASVMRRALVHSWLIIVSPNSLRCHAHELPRCGSIRVHQNMHVVANSKSIASRVQWGRLGMSQESASVTPHVAMCHGRSALRCLLVRGQQKIDSLVCSSLWYS